MKSKDKKSTGKKNSGSMKKDRVVVLLESIEGQVKTVAEGHSVLGIKMDVLGEKVDKLDFRMDKMEIKMDRMEIKMDSLESKVDEGFKLVLDHLDGLDREFMELRKDLENNYEKKGHDAAWRKAIEERLGNLEKLLMAKKFAKA